MVISDYNTNGLKGLSKKGHSARGTQWDNLIIRKGTSKREGPGGGSYGIGKHAPFGISMLRSVFYYTETTNGEKGYIWNSILGDHDYNSKLKPQEVNIAYDSTDNITPLRAITDIDSRPSFLLIDLLRTDICILGYKRQKDSDNPWNVKFHKELLNNYFAAIYDNHLILKFLDETNNKKIDYTIDKNNIFEFMSRGNSCDNLELLDAYAKSMMRNLKKILKIWVNA